MKNIIILLIFVSSVCNAQIKNFFKYSTFYTSMSMSTSFSERENYIAVDKGYEDITTINPYDYNLTVGIRKIARFDYEYKALKNLLQIMLLLVMLLVGSICLIILLYGIVAKYLLIKIIGLGTLEIAA